MKLRLKIRIRMLSEIDCTSVMLGSFHCSLIFAVVDHLNTVEPV
jgi:hypothetical protein